MKQHTSYSLFQIYLFNQPPKIVLSYNAQIITSQYSTRKSIFVQLNLDTIYCNKLSLVVSYTIQSYTRTAISHLIVSHHMYKSI